MAKTKPDKRRSKASKKLSAKSDFGASSFSPELAQSLLDEATAQLQTGEAEQALATATRLEKLLTQPSVPSPLQLPALELLGEIHIELGNPDPARVAFQQAATLDPEAALPGGAADKFLWLAQLSEAGGEESVHWFEKGIAALRRDTAGAGEPRKRKTAPLDEADDVALELKRRKLASALCGAAEVYMTDLSWEADAEARCEALVTEACVVAPGSPEALQTLANVRLSQARVEDAQAALRRSVDIWRDLPDQHPDIPDFPTRISLARLLMEAEMEDTALDVLERLVAEDDSSVEAWYLGGWCIRLLSDKQDSADADAAAKKTSMMKGSRDWLQNSLRLYDVLDYEDDRLRDHARELVGELTATLGPLASEGADDDDDGWEDAEEDEADDESMGDS